MGIWEVEGETNKITGSLLNYVRENFLTSGRHFFFINLGIWTPCYINLSEIARRCEIRTDLCYVQCTCYINLSEIA